MGAQDKWVVAARKEMEKFYVEQGVQALQSKYDSLKSEYYHLKDKMESTCKECSEMLDHMDSLNDKINDLKKQVVQLLAVHTTTDEAQKHPCAILTI